MRRILPPFAGCVITFEDHDNRELFEILMAGQQIEFALVFFQFILVIRFFYLFRHDPGF